MNDLKNITPLRYNEGLNKLVSLIKSRITKGTPGVHRLFRSEIMEFLKKELPVDDEGRILGHTNHKIVRMIHTVHFGLKEESLKKILAVRFKGENPESCYNGYYIDYEKEEREKSRMKEFEKESAEREADRIAEKTYIAPPPKPDYDAMMKDEKQDPFGEVE